MKSPWEHFTLEELSCFCCGRMLMDRKFMERIVEAREMCGFPWPVTSGYRCEKYNQKVSTTGKHGPHTTGHALDIHVLGREAGIIIDALLMCDIYIPEDHGRGGIGLHQSGKHRKRFIHVDNLQDGQTKGPRPWIWTYG